MLFKSRNFFASECLQVYLYVNSIYFDTANVRYVLVKSSIWSDVCGLSWEKKWIVWKQFLCWMKWLHWNKRVNYCVNNWIKENESKELRKYDPIRIGLRLLRLLWKRFMNYLMIQKSEMKVYRNSSKIKESLIKMPKGRWSAGLKNCFCLQQRSLPIVGIFVLIIASVLQCISASGMFDSLSCRKRSSAHRGTFLKSSLWL